MMTIWYPLCANMHIMYSGCTIFVIVLFRSFFLELMNQMHHSYLLISYQIVIICINKCVAAFNIKVPIKRLMNRYEEYKSIKIPIQQLINRYEEESKEVRQIILCRMLKYNEMHLFKHVLLKYTLKVFLVYYSIKIVTTCLYNEGKMKVLKNR